MHKIAVIIANYNYGEYVVSAIKSALSQTHQNVVVYVVNDGSTDDSVKRIMSFDFHTTCNGYVSLPYYSGKCDVYLSKDQRLVFMDIDNSGASTARNVAIKRAIRDHKDLYAVCILDADDEMVPTKVEKMLSKMISNSDIGVVYADYKIVRSGNLGNYSKVEFKQPYDKDVLSKECIVHSGSLIKKDYLTQVELPNGEIYDSKLHGPLSKGFIGCTEDYDLWLRLSRNCIIYHIPEQLSIVRETGKNQSLKMNGSIFKQNMEIIANRT
jgi:glycosyltransferase involved in cell wall biosynthesis